MLFFLVDMIAHTIFLYSNKKKLYKPCQYLVELTVSMEYYLKRKQNKKDMSCNECEDSSRSLQEQPCGCGDDSEKQRSITPEEDVVSVNNVCRNEKESSESCSSSSSCCSTSGESDSEDSGIGDLTGKNIVSISLDYCVMSPPTEWSSDEEEDEDSQDSDDER